MKAAPIIAALAAAVSAGGVPSCSINCLADALSKNGCDNVDFVCGCKKFSHIQNHATPCILTDCGMGQAVQEVLPAVKAVCDKVKKEEKEKEKCQGAPKQEGQPFYA